MTRTKRCYPRWLEEEEEEEEEEAVPRQGQARGLERTPTVTT